MRTSSSVLFRCDGSPKIGLGHVVRCLALADELREVYGCRITFAVCNGSLGRDMIIEKNYHILSPPDGVRLFDYGQWLEDVIDDVGAHTLVLDVRDDLQRSAVEKLREQGILIVTLDDPSDRRLAADLAFYPPVPQVSRADWTGFTGELHVGWEWVVLRPVFANRVSRLPHKKPVVLVTMGGSDPAGLTMKAVEALDLLDEGFETVVVLGPAFSHQGALRDLLAKTHRHFDVRQNVTDMAGLMTQADLAVASFGVTAYELAAVGVPAIYLCLTEDHAESASAFVEAGIAMSLGMHSDVTPDTLARSVLSLLDNDESRIKMAAQASALVDGRGATRIADRIVMEV